MQLHVHVHVHAIFLLLFLMEYRNVARAFYSAQNLRNYEPTMANGSCMVIINKMTDNKVQGWLAFARELRSFQLGGLIRLDNHEKLPHVPACQSLQIDSLQLRTKNAVGNVISYKKISLHRSSSIILHYKLISCFLFVQDLFVNCNKSCTLAAQFRGFCSKFCKSEIVSLSRA